MNDHNEIVKLLDGSLMDQYSALKYLRDDHTGRDAEALLGFLPRIVRILSQSANEKFQFFAVQIMANISTQPKYIIRFWERLRQNAALKIFTQFLISGETLEHKSMLIHVIVTIFEHVQLKDHYLKEFLEDMFSASNSAKKSCFDSILLFFFAELDVNNMRRPGVFLTRIAEFLGIAFKERCATHFEDVEVYVPALHGLFAKLNQQYNGAWTDWQKFFFNVVAGLMKTEFDGTSKWAPLFKKALDDEFLAPRRVETIQILFDCIKFENNSDFTKKCERIIWEEVSHYIRKRESHNQTISLESKIMDIIGNYLDGNRTQEKIQVLFDKGIISAIMIFLDRIDAGGVRRIVEESEEKTMRDYESISDPDDDNYYCEEEKEIFLMEYNSIAEKGMRIFRSIVAGASDKQNRTILSLENEHSQKFCTFSLFCVKLFSFMDKDDKDEEIRDDAREKSTNKSHQNGIRDSYDRKQKEFERMDVVCQILKTLVEKKLFFDDDAEFSRAMFYTKQFVETRIKLKGEISKLEIEYKKKKN